MLADWMQCTFLFWSDLTLKSMFQRFKLARSKRKKCSYVIPRYYNHELYLVFKDLVPTAYVWCSWSVPMCHSWFHLEEKSCYMGSAALQQVVHVPAYAHVTHLPANIPSLFHSKYKELSTVLAQLQKEYKWVFKNEIKVTKEEAKYLAVAHCN